MKSAVAPPTPTVVDVGSARIESTRVLLWSVSGPDLELTLMTQVSAPTSRGGDTSLAPGRPRMAPATVDTWSDAEAGAVTATVIGVLASVAKSRWRALETCRADALTGRTPASTDVKRMPRKGRPATMS